MSETTDQLLVQRCLDGDMKAYEVLVQRYQTVMYNIALRMTGDREDAEDLTQSMFVKAYESLSRYKPEHKFFSWIYRITVNESLNFLSKRRHTVELDDHVPGTDKSPEDACHESEMSEVITKALSELSFDYRIVVVLRHFVDMSYREMSEIIGIPVKTVKSRLYSARQMLSSILIRRGVVSYE